MYQGTARKTHPRSLRTSQGPSAPLPSPGDEQVVEVDANGICVNVWATGGGELGSKILGLKISDVVGEDIYRSIQPLFRRVMETQKSEVVEHALPVGSGERLVPLPAGSGCPSRRLRQTADHPYQRRNLP